MKEQPRLHIGIIQQTPDIGGAETHMYSLIEQFQQYAAIVSLATNNEKFIHLLKPLNVPIYRIPIILDVIGNYRGLIKSLLLLPLATLFYRRLLKDFKKDGVEVLLMSGFSEKMLVTLLAKWFRIPVVWIEHGPLSTIFQRNFSLPKLFYRSLSTLPYRIVTPSKYTRTNLIKEGVVTPAKVQWIPDGVLLPPKKRIRKEQINCAWRERFIIGCVSRLTREKGQQFLIQAMPIVRRSIPNALLVIIGAGFDEQYFKHLVKQLDLEEYVHFAGFVENLSDYYQIMDVFVFPTIWDLEGFGLVTIEAMAYGVPVIGTDFGPVKEVIAQNETGILVQPGSGEALAEKIILLAKSKKRRLFLSQNARKQVEKIYTIDAVSEQFIDVLQKAVYAKG